MEVKKAFVEWSIKFEKWLEVYSRPVYEGKLQRSCNYKKIYLWLLLFFLTVRCCGQIEEVTMISYSVVSGYSLYYQVMDRNAFAKGDKIYKYYSKRWHELQTAELVNLLCVGIQIGILRKDKPYLAVVDAMEVAAIRWIVRDGIYQSLLGNSFWNQSKNTTSQFERFGTPLVKITFLLTVVLIKYLVIPMLN